MVPCIGDVGSSILIEWYLSERVSFFFIRATHDIDIITFLLITTVCSCSEQG